METYKYFEILRKKSFIFKRENIEEKLFAISQIAINGNISDINYLIEFLINKNSLIRKQTVSAINFLLKKVKSKNQIYDSLKYCNITLNNLNFFIKNFTEEELETILIIGTLNHNGYVREESLNLLGKIKISSLSIPFIFYRLSDWVQNVRDKSLENFHRLYSKGNINLIINNLYLFNQIEKIQRVDLSNIRQQTFKFLIENRDIITNNFKNYSDKNRKIISDYFCTHVILLENEITLFLNDRNYLVRLSLLKKIEILNQDKIDKLLSDKNYRVRIETMYAMEKRQIPINYNQFIADEASSIRDFCRYHLKRKNESFDFESYYLQNIENSIQIPSSIYGLGEINAVNSVKKIVAFLENKNFKILKAAFIALSKLEKEKSLSFALQNYKNSNLTVRNLCFKFLFENINNDLIEKFKYEFMKEDQYLKKSFLKFFSKVNGWKAIDIIILGTIDENEEIRNISLNYLKRWKIKAANLFLNPSDNEFKMIKEAYDKANKVHEEKKYFNENPLFGFNLYLK